MALHWHTKCGICIPVIAPVMQCQRQARESHKDNSTARKQQHQALSHRVAHTHGPRLL